MEEKFLHGFPPSRRPPRPLASFKFVSLRPVLATAQLVSCARRGRRAGKDRAFGGCERVLLILVDVEIIVRALKPGRWGGLGRQKPRDVRLNLGARSRVYQHVRCGESNFQAVRASPVSAKNPH